MKRKRIARAWLPPVLGWDIRWWKYEANNRDRLIGREIERQRRKGVEKIWVKWHGKIYQLERSQAINER